MRNLNVVCGGSVEVSYANRRCSFEQDLVRSGGRIACGYEYSRFYKIGEFLHQLSHGRLLKRGPALCSGFESRTPADCGSR